MDLNVLVTLAAMFNMVADVLCIVMTKSWLLESGIYFLTRFPEYLPLFDLVLFSLILLLHKLAYFTENKQIADAYVFLCIVLTFINGYYAVNWVLDPKAFFSNLLPQWSIMINSPQLRYVENKFRCCGLNKIGENPNDRCTESKSKSCAKILCMHYQSNMRGSGVFAFTSSASALFIILIYVFLQKKKKARNLHRGQPVDDF